MFSLHRMMASSALALSMCAPAFAQETPPPALVESPPAATEAAKPTATGLSPILPVVRQQLASASLKGADEQDRAALVALYSNPERTLLWVTDSGLTPRAVALVAEFKSAADWGLTPASFVVPDLQTAVTSPEALADAEVRIGLAALRYARHARGGRLDVSLLGRNFDQKPPLLEPKSVAEGLASAPDAAAYLRGLHPRHPQFEKLRQAMLAARKPQAVAETPAPGSEIKLPAGPRVKPGQIHPQVSLLRQRLNIPATDDQAERLDDTLKDALITFQQSKGLNADGSLNNATRTALNGTVKVTTSGDQVQRILVNMERWRWLPEELGQFHVWDNVPEFRMRVLKDGKVVHAETIIVGKPATPTPVFSADMKYVIFHPTWGVPDGIKMNELAPSLRRSASGSNWFWGGESEPSILRAHKLQVSYNGRPINPATVNWQTADIRSFQFTQPPSATNVLGVVKFRFPNKHDVYMHDTPERALFSRADKAFSHGCMRVQNPRRLAEVLLAEDQGWTAAQVGNALAGGATHDVTLNKQIPVHVTYFTAVVEEDGRLKTFNDIYGHDSRIASALEGKPIRLIEQSDPAVRAEREVRRQTPKRTASNGGGGGLLDIFSGLGGN